MKRTVYTKAQRHFTGPWQILTAVRGCLCPDGQRRYVRVSNMDSGSASVHAFGRTIAGGVCFDSASQDYYFVPALESKNANLFAQWLNEHDRDVIDYIRAGATSQRAWEMADANQLRRTMGLLMSVKEVRHDDPRLPIRGDRTFNRELSQDTARSRVMDFAYIEADSPGGVAPTNVNRPVVTDQHPYILETMKRYDDWFASASSEPFYIKAGNWEMYIAHTGKPAYNPGS